eukprot:TRINITY_DN6353_c0_g1_i14.p1 TRINITY_DN6353_c0_g1~~TRINITY_DN6353_c0_g1_i14.p1  ORF type:complete len:141 (+),score=5.19 TRINITY_DN6353_c0_g1_i14:207-629(+)
MPKGKGESSRHSRLLENEGQLQSSNYQSFSEAQESRSFRAPPRPWSRPLSHVPLSPSLSLPACELDMLQSVSCPFRSVYSSICICISLSLLSSFSAGAPFTGHTDTTMSSTVADDGVNTVSTTRTEYTLASEGMQISSSL